MKTFLTKYFIEREKSSDLDFLSFLFSRLNKWCGGNIVMFQVINAREREFLLLLPHSCSPSNAAQSIQYYQQQQFSFYTSWT